MRKRGREKNEILGDSRIPAEIFVKQCVGTVQKNQEEKPEASKGI